MQRLIEAEITKERRHIGVHRGRLRGLRFALAVLMQKQQPGRQAPKLRVVR
jgi:hypothetical protein